MLLFGVVADQPNPAATRKISTISRGPVLCNSHEAYRRVVPQTRIDFEHAAFLAKALIAGKEIRLSSALPARP